MRTEDRAGVCGCFCGCRCCWLSSYAVARGAGIRGGPFRVVRREGLRIVVVWRRATFPHPVGWSIIAVPGLSFQVRNGAGRFPWAMAATSLSVMRPHRVVGGCVVVGGPDGGRRV